MARLNLPFVLEQLDILIDDEVYEQAERGTVQELNLLEHLETAIRNHLTERLAAAGPDGTADSPAEDDEDFEGLDAAFDSFEVEDESMDAEALAS